MGAPQDVAKGLDLFRTLVFDNAVEAAMVDYLGPVLAIPVLGYVVKTMILKFADALYNRLEGIVVLGSVLFVDAVHRKAFETASIGLKQIALEKGLNSPEYKEAHEREKQALKKFGQFNVVQPGLSG